MPGPAPSVPTAHPRWRRRKDSRPAEILSAALSVFVERGYAATKLDDVARQAGVSKGTMYLYFESKEALFKEVVRASVVPEIERAEQRVQSHSGTARRLLEELIEGWWAVLGESRLSGLAKLMMGEANNFPELAQFWFEEVVRRSHAVTASAVQLGINLGEFRPVDTRLAARLAIAPLLHAAVMNHSIHRCTYEPADHRALVRLHTELFLRGLAAHPKPRHE
jgi:AcrR family transcriptional regulator